MKLETRMRTRRWRVRTNLDTRGRGVPTFQLLAAPCLILLACGFFLFPFVWMVGTAFKDPRLLYAEPAIWLPWPPTLQNFRDALALVPFWRHFGNSLVVALVSTAGVVLSSSLGGFAFAYLPAPGRRALFTVLVATLALPPALTIVPSFMLFSILGWVGTWLPLVVPRWCGDALFVFMFRQFFRGLPREILDSARVDGCDSWGLYRRIALPMARPAVVLAAVFAFLTSWNDYQGPLLYLGERSQWTLPLALALFANERYTQVHLMMPLALLALLPVLLIFVLSQHLLVEGVSIRKRSDA